MTTAGAAHPNLYSCGRNGVSALSLRPHVGGNCEIVMGWNSSSRHEYGLWRIRLGHGDDHGACACDFARIGNVSHSVDRLDSRWPAGRHHLCHGRWFDANAFVTDLSWTLHHYPIGEGAGDRGGEWILH